MRDFKVSSEGPSSERNKKGLGSKRVVKLGQASYSVYQQYTNLFIFPQLDLYLNTAYAPHNVYCTIWTILSDGSIKTTK